jgi:formamidopyrimidine-DNA glycosylase
VPELPDLLYVMGVLRPALVGRTVAAARLTSPVVLRSLVKGDLSLLVGRSMDGLLRRGHFLVFRFGDLDLAVNPMLAGRFKLADPGSRLEAAAGFVLTFQPGPDLRYLDDKKMGKAYLLPAGAWKGVPGMEGGGLDVLSPDFTVDRFRERLRGRRDQVRAFVMDKRALDSLGNAYADEVLFEAGIHPKTWCRALGPDDAARLHAAIVTVMRAAAEEVERRHEPIEVKVRDFLQIRRRTVCPRCGAKVRKAGVRGMDSYFCPRCQPETRPGLVDWRKTGV